MASSLAAALDNTDVRDADTLDKTGEFTHVAVWNDNTKELFLSPIAEFKDKVLPPAGANQAPLVTLAVSPNGITLGASTSLTATATDPDGTIASVTFFDGTTTLGASTTPPFTLSYKPTTVGTHQIKAVAIDNGGASATTSLPLVVVAAPTPAAPAPVLTFAPVGNKAVGDAAVALSVTSTNTVTPIGIVSSNGAAVALAQSGGTYTATFPAAGTSTLTATQAAGNGYAAGSASQVVTVSAVATQKPVVGLEINPQNINLGDSSQLFASPSSANSTVVSVRFFDNGTQIGAPVTSAPFQLMYTPPQAGVRAITARATDALGVESDPSNVQNLTVTGPPPSYNRTISKTLPAGSPEQSDGIVFKADTSQELSFDALSNVAGNNVSLQITDSSNGSVCYADLFDDYANKPYSFKRADGSFYYGTFPDKDTNFTA